MGLEIKDAPVDILNAPEIALVSPKPSRGSMVQKKPNNHDDEHKLNQKISNRNKIITSLAAGAVAGAVAKTTIAPLDRTKINFQISQKQYSFKAAFRFLYRTVKYEGVLTLWRGNSATMARIIPYASIQYAAHEQWKRILNTKNERNLAPVPRFVAGSLAGMTATAICYPLDMVRARMAVTEKQTYKSLSEAFVKIYRTEGFRMLYRGISPTMLGVIPYSGTGFFTYETLKKRHSEKTGGKQPAPLQRLCFGAIAGLLGQTSSYPLDIVRRRMQTAGVTGHTKDYPNIVKTLKFVYQKEGLIKGLYKGLSMNWIKGPIAVGISFALFDITQKQLRRIEFFHE